MDSLLSVYIVNSNEISNYQHHSYAHMLMKQHPRGIVKESYLQVTKNWKSKKCHTVKCFFVYI